MGGRLLAGCLRAREVLVQQDGGEDWEVLRGGGGAPDPHPWHGSSVQQDGSEAGEVLRGITGENRRGRRTTRGQRGSALELCSGEPIEGARGKMRAVNFFIFLGHVADMWAPHVS